MSGQKLQLYLEYALGLVNEASAVIKEKIWAKKEGVVQKSHRSDLVTKTDKLIEDMLINNLKNKFLDHKFIGEESAAAGQKVELTDDPTWIIDPIDGTLNFVHGYPNVCISVAMTLRKEVLLGIIDIPVMGMQITAIKGCGTFMNGRKLNVSSVTALQNALVSLEIPMSGQSVERIQSVRATCDSLRTKIHGLRSSGSAAFNLAMVGLGASDCYIEIGIHAWDYAAGVLIVTEAGGVVMDPEGKPLDLMSRRVLAASSKSLADEIIPHIVQYYPKRDDA